MFLKTTLSKYVMYLILQEKYTEKYINIKFLPFIFYYPFRRKIFKWRLPLNEN